MALWGIDFDEDLARVRALRTRPPGAAGASDDRREVFGAALEQFEQLLHASRRVGAAAAPITLFYSLGQAGRAIAAALAPNDCWRIRGHGLRVEAGSPLGATVILPKKTRQDSFSVVSGAVGSAPLTSPTTLGAAWAATPNAWVEDGLGAANPPALRVEREQIPDVEWRGRLWGEIADDLPHEAEAATDILVNRLAPYPDAAKDLAVMEVVGQEATSRGEAAVSVGWADDGTGGRTLHRIAPPFVSDGGHFLRPGLGANADPVSPLMAWWIVLLALSSVARYEPSLWVRSLDRDRSPFAVPIEHGLNRWRELAPAMILYALTHPDA
jgi:hypothetical protein